MIILKGTKKSFEWKKKRKVKSSKLGKIHPNGIGFSPFVHFMIQILLHKFNGI